jgi:heme A synthase
MSVFFDVREKEMLKSIWFFLGLYQTKRVRILHVLILTFVLTQIIISNWMAGTKLENIPALDSTYFFTWMHITIGLTLFFLTFMLIITCFTQRGIRHFYPYLWGDFKQIKSDLKQLFSFKLPDSSPYGLAASVQGLGLGALSIVILSGIAWFILWVQHSPSALEARSLHKSLTIFIEIYIYGHGGLAILHFIIWYKNRKA